MKFSYYYIFEGEESRRYKFKNKNMLLNTGFLKSPVLSLTKPEMVKAFDLIQFKYFISLKRIVISYEIIHEGGGVLLAPISFAHSPENLKWKTTLNGFPVSTKNILVSIDGISHDSVTRQFTISYLRCHKNFGIAICRHIYHFVHQDNMVFIITKI